MCRTMCVTSTIPELKLNPIHLLRKAFIDVCFHRSSSWLERSIQESCPLKLVHFISNHSSVNKLTLWQVCLTRGQFTFGAWLNENVALSLQRWSLQEKLKEIIVITADDYKLTNTKSFHHLYNNYIIKIRHKAHTQTSFPVISSQSRRTRCLI